MNNRINSKGKVWVLLIISLIYLVLICCVAIYLGKKGLTHNMEVYYIVSFVMAFIFKLITIPVHEYVHSICFQKLGNIKKENIKISYSFKKGKCEIMNGQTLSKRAFILSAVLPSIVELLLMVVIYLIAKNNVFLLFYSLGVLLGSTNDFVMAFKAFKINSGDRLLYVGNLEFEVISE